MCVAGTGVASCHVSEEVMMLKRAQTLLLIAGLLMATASESRGTTGLVLALLCMASFASLLALSAIARANKASRGDGNAKREPDVVLSTPARGRIASWGCGFTFTTLSPPHDPRGGRAVAGKGGPCGMPPAGCNHRGR